MLSGHRWWRRPTFRLSSSAIGLALLFAAVVLPASAMTPAHTVIQNQSTATYRWFGRDYGIASNSVNNTVAPYYGILLTPDGTVAEPGLTAYSEPGQTVYLPYTLLNTGNVTDSYDLSLSFLQGSFFPTQKKIYHDLNGNGRLDSGEPEVTSIELLPAGGQAHLIVSLTVPPNASYGQEVYHDVIGKSVGDPTKIDQQNVNLVQLVYDAVLKITKTPAVAQVEPGGEVEFTLSVINLGSFKANPDVVRVNGLERQGILVADLLPGIAEAEITYVPGSLNGNPSQYRRLFRLAGEDDWRELSAAEEETLAAEIVEIGVLFENGPGLLVPGQQAQVRFSLAIADNHPSKKIHNTSRVHYRSRFGEPRQDLSTNTVQVTVLARTSNILIGPYNDPDAVGNIFGPVDNNGDATYDPGVPVTAPNPYGTQVVGNMVYFLNTVRNDSNSVDTINLTIDSLTNLPADWLPLVRLMAVSGIEPRYLGDSSQPFLHPETGQQLFTPSNVSTLFDTNGDGIPDTGPLAPGATYTLAVRMLIPADALTKGGSQQRTRAGGLPGQMEGYDDNNGHGYRVTVRATSTIDPTKSNLTSNVVKRIMAVGDFWDPFEKVQHVANVVTVGTTVEYVNIFGNNGPGPVYNAIISDKLSTHLTNAQNITQGEVSDIKGSGKKITVTGSYDSLTHTVSWHIPEIPAGFKGRIGFSVDVAPGTPDGTEILNTFAITSDQTETTRYSNEVVHAVGGEKILTITKKVSNDKAEIGDPVRYELEVANAGSETIRKVIVDDRLPRGFRYLQGTCRVDGVKVEPEVSEDGLSLRWELGTLHAGAKVVISYACMVTSDARLGHNTNTAAANGVLPKGSPIGSTDSADVEIEQGIFHNDSVIIGKVFIDQNDDRMQNYAEPGIQGVRLILENGTYVITDREGKYHFSGIKPGMHVLRMDETTLPPGMTPAIIDSQNALNPLSRTIELKYGTPHKANFRVLPKKEKTDSLPTGDDGAVITPAAGATGAMPAATVTDQAEPGTAPVAAGDNVLLPVQVSRQGDASVLAIACESPLETTWEHDQQSGIVHLMLPGVVTSKQALRQVLDDPNVSSVQCYLDEDQQRAKVQVRMRRRSSGYQPVQVEVTANGAILRVGQEIAPDHDPEPGMTARKKQRLAAMPELVPLILTPEDGDAFISSGQISVTAACFLAGQATLLINGEAVPESRIGQRSVDVEARRMTYVFYGLSLQPGSNKIRLEVINPGDTEPAVAEITVMRSSTPKKLQLEVIPRQLMADSLTEPQVKVTLLDENGVPTGHGSVVTITVDKGDILSPDLRLTEPGHQAQVRDGSAIVRLSSASEPETRQLRIIAGDLEQTLPIVFEPHQRSWIVSGIASGTATDQKSLRRDGSHDRDWEFDKRIAFFAKGSLPHDMVLTTSYDSKKPRDDDKIFQADDPLKYYPVYGDDSEQQYEAESRDKLYIKLERHQSYAMYGDFDTEMDKAELAAYRRTMTGAKLHLEEKYIDVDAFYSRNDQVKIKGLEIRGRGVSGYYTLPDRNIIYNSEQVVIETRDRWHPDQVLKSDAMRRFTDYSIDYDTGRILFKKPVMSRDEDNNPIYIVVDYEVDGLKSKNYNTYGGRVELHNEARTMYIGATHIQDESSPHDHVIQGVDAKIELMPGLTLAGEVAQSTSTEDIDGSAMRLELEGEYERANYRLYYRKIGSDFDNDSMSGDTAGRTTVGFEGEFQITETWSTKEDFYIETDKVGERKRHVAIHDFVHKKDSRELLIGLGYTDEKDISDSDAAGSHKRSPFVRVGAAFDLTQKLRLEMLHQHAFGDKETDQSTRSSAELRYSATPNVDLLLGMERREINGDDTEFNLTGGIELRLSESVSAFNRYKLEDSANGQRVRAGTGLDANYQLDENWKVGGTIEINRAVKEKGDLGNDDFWALTLSTEYQPVNGAGTAIARYEVRDDDNETSHLGEIGGTVKLNIDHTLFGRNIANYIRGKDDKNDSLSLDFLVGWAYRPVEVDDFNLISDLELKYEKDTDVADYGRMNKLILSTEANWQPVRRLTLEGKYACKVVDTSYLSSDLYSDVKALAARVDLHDRVFVSAGARILSQYDSNTHTIGYGVTVGVNVAKDFQVAVGYNFDGFKDKDFSRGEHWQKGFFVAFHWKFDESIFGILNRLEGKK